jgi:hypothetical protein
VRALLTSLLISNITISILIWKLNKTIKHEKYILGIEMMLIGRYGGCTGITWFKGVG